MSEFADDIAEIIAGLQVPHSIAGEQVLGQAAAPWRRMYQHLGIQGWVTAEEIKPKVREAIAREVIDAMARYQTSQP